MVGIIDTSSLVAIARYYLTLKDEAPLLRFFERKFRNGDILLLGTILREARYTQKGIALEKMPFLEDKSVIINDDELAPVSPRKFSNQVDNNFCIRPQKKNLSEDIYIQLKDEFLKSGDAKLIIYALNAGKNAPTIITEETPYANDGKLFRKIPSICNMLDIKYMTIYEWMDLNNIKIDWNHPDIPR